MRIGITGNIASGKSVVLKYLASKGYSCFSCDSCVGELYNQSDVEAAILKIFPELAIIDKKLIAKMIYENSSKREALEELIHPLVAKKLEEFLLNSQNNQTVFLEIPLLFEAGWEKYCDYIITLYCDKKIRQERLKERGISEALFYAIEKTRLDEEIKIQKSDFSIDTSRPWDEVLEKLDSVLTCFL